MHDPELDLEPVRSRLHALEADSHVVDARVLEQALLPLSRRRFLLAGAALSAATLAGLSTACSPGGDAPELLPVAGLKVLTPDEARLFQRLIPVFLPTRGTELVDPARVPVLANLDEIFVALKPQVRSDLGKGLQLFDYSAIVLGWNFKRFTSLDDEAATAHCKRWMEGNRIQRSLFAALKQFIYFSYWRDAATWPAVGYDGPISRARGYLALGNAPLPADVLAPPDQAPADQTSSEQVPAGQAPTGQAPAATLE